MNNYQLIQVVLKRGMKLRTVFGALALLLTLAGTGCAYRPSNALPKHIKTVAVPYFKNRTYNNEYSRRLEVEVTEAARNAFIQAGELKLVPREEADVIVEGEVLKANRDTLRTTRFGEPSEVRYEIQVSISAYDVREAKYLFRGLRVNNTENKNESGVYNLLRGEYEGLGRKKASEDIGRAVARSVTEYWPGKDDQKVKSPAVAPKKLGQ